MGATGDIIFSGLFQGSLYAIMAVGLALIWTTIGVFNFAHGALMMIGAYATWSAVDYLGLPLPLGLFLGVAASGLIGWGLQVSLIRPFIGRDDIVLMVVIMTLSAASFFENGALELWGPRPKQLPPLVEGTVNLPGLIVSAHQLAIILISPFILAAIWYLLHKTRFGLQLRAVAQNEEASQLVGLNLKALYGIAFALSAGLAALAGIFLGGFKFMSPVMGSDPLLKAMVVVIFGGVATISGPILAAFIIGFIEAASSYYFGLYWTPAILFLVLITTLMIRPEGLLSTPTRRLS
ncbi:branched-chain amino acid ABC transporter permease [Aquibium oceanicum]|uniref:Branched-chain amino acid ABC transporter permease n=1 Tax=Aquibium oceanicum TaxID=1670800 RepID=A0A1L3SUM6_9HYPH|nr:branched-chain amino acid ABC transporter permease [Aquibium oceanicum]APH73137.1 branched-chain amino acid ABC transporter permease [Aquibium oceanicum]